MIGNHGQLSGIALQLIGKVKNITRKAGNLIGNG
jgi:hypothetical protein